MNGGAFMETRENLRKSRNIVHRALMALVLAIAGLGLSIGVSSPAQAATTTMCSSSPVPAGYVVTGAYNNTPNCGNFVLYTIRRL
jgi:hypothetical protein